MYVCVRVRACINFNYFMFVFDCVCCYHFVVNKDVYNELQADEPACIGKQPFSVSGTSDTRKVKMQDTTTSTTNNIMECNQ